MSVKPNGVTQDVWEKALRLAYEIEMLSISGKAKDISRAIMDAKSEGRKETLSFLKNPTDEMVRAAHDAFVGGSGPEEIFRDMINAARVPNPA